MLAFGSSILLAALYSVPGFMCFMSFDAFYLFIGLLSFIYLLYERNNSKELMDWVDGAVAGW